MPPKGKPRIWCGMPIPVRVGFLPGEEGRPPGKGTTAHRLAVVPCIGSRRRPQPRRAGRGGGGGVDLGLEGVVPRRTGLMTVDALLAGNGAVFWNAINHLVLPASLLGFHSLAYISRMTRSFMLAQLSQEFIITARVKGLTERQVIWNHAFRNILVQLLTVVALAYGSLLEGAVLIETVFSWPGFGSYLTGSLLLGDMNAVMGCVLLVGVIFVMLNLLSDMLYQLFDPRTKS